MTQTKAEQEANDFMWWWRETNKHLAEVGQTDVCYGDVKSFWERHVTPKEAAKALADERTGYASDTAGEDGECHYA